MQSVQPSCRVEPMSDSAHEQSVNFTIRLEDLDLSNLENEGVSSRALLRFRRGKVSTNDLKNLKSWETVFSRFGFPLAIITWFSSVSFSKISWSLNLLLYLNELMSQNGMKSRKILVLELLSRSQSSDASSTENSDSRTESFHFSPEKSVIECC